jgi:hypothetical protein
VSKDLGVPRAWVGKVRDEMFGPAGHDKDITELLEQFEKVDGLCKQVLAEQNQLLLKINEVRKQVGLH